MKQEILDFQEILGRHKSVTVLSHINPDPDAIGTALGIYSWLKEQGIRTEVVNATEDIPKFLDFLPNFSKIKQKMDFQDSLIVACDCGSIDRLGFDTSRREIVNIDHHATNTKFGILNIVNPNAVSSSEVAFGLLKEIYPVSKSSAICFYVALASDTRNFTTNNMHKEVFGVALELATLGVDIANVSSQVHHRRSLASLRMLGVALDSLELYQNGRVAVLKIYQEDMKRTGAKISNLDGIIDYAKSLVTVEIALMLVERRGDIKVSLRSKQVDISELSTFFGGGGHSVAGGFESKDSDIATLSQKLLEEIENRGLVS